MTWAATGVFHGASIYSRRPVIRYTWDLPSGGNEAPLLPANTEPLLALLPGLREHRAPCDAESLLARAGGAAASIAIPHLFEHLCIELQNLTGATLACLRSEGPRLPPGVSVIPCDDESVGLEAGNLSLEMIEGLRSPAFPPQLERRLQAFLRFGVRERLPAQDLAIVRSAELRDIPATRIAGRLVQLGHGRQQRRLNGTETSHTNAVSNNIAANKDHQRRLFKAVGLPVPAHERVSRVEDAVAAAKRIGFPVVLKPNTGNMGAGVSVRMRTEQEVSMAFERTRGLSTWALVEKYVRGMDYRMLVVQGRLVAASQRIPAHVVGDGAHSIKELVRRANKDPRRGEGQRGAWTRLEFDEQSDGLLAELAYDRRSVPRRGEIVYLRRIANTSAGGTAVDVTDQVHPENREIAERAAVVTGLDIAGVDLLVPDITQPMRAQGGVICEINSRPGIRKHIWPAEGKPRDVIGAILDMLYPPGSRSRIPIAVVTGMGDTASAARMLADLLAVNGTTIGLALKEGVFIGGKRVDGCARSGPSSTRLLLLDPTVDLAVLEVPPDDALLHGLGYDWADVCAVIDGRPADSPELVDALRLVVASARRHVVLSPEDEEEYGLQTQPGAKLWRVVNRASPGSSHAAERVPARNSGNGSGPARYELYAATLAQCLGTSTGDVERLASLALGAS